MTAAVAPASSPLDLALSAPRVELQRRRQARTLEALAHLPAAGGVLGTAAGVGLGGLLRSVLPGFSALGPLVPAGLATCFLAFAVLAGYFPARRALRIDLTQALRAE